MKIVGYFGSIKNAHEAADKLKQEGFSEAYTDLNDHYTLNNSPESSIPGTESAPSNASLVLNYGEPINDQDKAPLAAASPMVSGMGDFEEITDYSYKVIVDADSNSSENAKKIITNLGGDLKDPNLNMQNRIKDVSLNEAKIDDLTT
jgi:hypothetical protein